MQPAQATGYQLFGKPYTIVGSMQERGHIIGSMGENYVCLTWITFEKNALHLASWGATHLLRFPFAVDPLATLGAVVALGRE
nr:hypothetical protein [Candidatus Krumholzibacteria bacterium]